MAKSINAILNLKDNMSGGLFKVTTNLRGLDKESQKTARSFVAQTHKIKKSIDSIASKTKTFLKASGLALGGLALKKGFSEAFDLEGYRMQLETATKDTQKAGEIMTYAINLANKTPFEGGELVNAAAKFESMGMSAEYWLKRTGDMAAATNKSFDQATEALIDAQTGELERLKEFGIKKADIMAKADEMYGKKNSVVNNKGQITDLKNFNEALVVLMEEKFSGGMEKQASTVKGLWSTITGITKSGLASIVGMQQDGTVKSGSMLDHLKEKLKSVADRMTQWQQDGTIDKIADKFTKGFDKMYNIVAKFFKFISKHKTALKALAAGFISLKAASGALDIFKKAKEAVDIFKLFKGGKLKLPNISPKVMLISGAVAAIGAGLYLIYKNWDKISAHINENYPNIAAFMENAKSLLGGIGKAGIWIVDKVLKVGSALFKNTVEIVKEFVNLLKLLGEGLLKIGEMGAKPFNWVWQQGKNFWQGLTGTYDDDEPKRPKKPGHNALGTPYWGGGPTYINERGGEIVDLPRGTRIIPHDKSRKIANGANISVYVTVEGNIIGNSEYADYMGERVCQKILTELKKM